MTPHPSYQRIYATVRRIPRGRVLAYGEVAELADLPGQARQVGYALHALSEDTDVPWHRVVNAQGRVALRSAGPGAALQRALLEGEGVVLLPSAGGVRIDMDRYRWRPRATLRGRSKETPMAGAASKKKKSNKRSFWLVKSEPAKYSWDAFVSDGSTYWDGVRNYTARNNLREMAPGDWALYYHSNEGKEVVGIAEITKSAYPDPTTDDDRWVVVDLKPLCPLEKAVTLADIKQDESLQDMILVKQSRLSVMPVSATHFKRVLRLGGTKPPAS